MRSTQLLGSALIGGVAVPPLMGQIIAVTEADVIPVLLAVVALATTALAVVLMRTPDACNHARARLTSSRRLPARRCGTLVAADGTVHLLIPVVAVVHGMVARRGATRPGACTIEHDQPRAAATDVAHHTAALTTRGARMLAAAAFAVYIVIGATQAYYGPAIPSLRERFGVTAAAAGLAVGAHFLGAIAGVVVWAILERRTSPRVLLVAADVLVAAGCVLLVLSGTWQQALPAILLIGVGFGGLDVGYNVVFAHAYGSRAPVMLNLLHACFGIGAIVGPIAVSVSPGGDFRPAFLASGLLAVVAVPLILAGPPLDPPDVSPPIDAPDTGRRTLALFVVLFVLYVGVETGVGGWAPTHLITTGRTVAEAARWTAGFWAAFTAGRLVAAGLAARVRSDRLVTGALLCAIVALVAATQPSIAPLAYVATGLALAPVFPTGIAWLTQALPRARGSTALVLGSALLGGVTVPPLIGQIISVTGPELVPVLLSAIAAAATVLAVMLMSSAAVPAARSRRTAS